MAWHLPWVEKYRPQNIAEVKGHEHIVTVLRSYGVISRIPHLLFYGPPGTGKTSTILAMAKEHYGPDFKCKVMEVNASDERGVEVVTGKIKSFVETSSLAKSDSLGVKLVVLDEVDALTAEAQSALRRIMEKSSARVRFCLCCNYVSKISMPLQSRCTKFRFEGIDRASLRDMVVEVSQKENLSLGDGAIDAVLDLASGDARRVINLLQSASLSTDSSGVSAEYVYQLAGSPLPCDVDRVLCILSEKSLKDSVIEIKNLVNHKGYAVTDLVTDLTPRVLDAFANDSTRLCTLLDEFSTIENNLSVGGSESLAVGHLVSAFHLD